MNVEMAEGHRFLMEKILLIEETGIEYTHFF